MMRYTIIYEKSPTGYGAYVPDLPGLGVVAKTLDEVKLLIREGIDIYLAELRESGEEIPAPTSTAEEFEVAISA